MGVAAMQDRAGPYGEAEYLAIPEDGQRHELIDGALVMSPAPGRDHQRISSRLWNTLDQAVPDGFEVHEVINIRLGPDRILIPDVAVLTTVGGHEKVVPAEDVAIFIEIMSPSSKRIDRLLKPGLVAEARIPQYWLIDPEGPVVSIYELVDGEYKLSVEASGERRMSLMEPFPVDFQPIQLLASRREK